MERQEQLKKQLTILSTMDEHYMSEGMNNQQQKRLQFQQRWFKKGMTSPLLTPESNRDDDPFAGMTTGVNYQQEIERIKSIVPKVDSSKKATHRRLKSVGAYNNNNNYYNSNNNVVGSTVTNSNTIGKMKPMVLPPPTFSRRSSPPSPPSSTNNNINNMNSSRLSTTSAESTPSSSPYYDASSRMTSPSLSTPRSLSPIQSDYTSTTFPPVPEEDEQQCVMLDDEEQEDDYNQQRSVITEEEKTRFLQFMRNWTGGWKQWERNSRYNNNVDDDDDDVADGHYSGMEFVRGGGSLWAEQLPWTKHTTHQRRCSLQEARSNSHHHHRPLTVTLPDRKFVISMRSEPCTPLLAPR
ncbi:hypothetical protein INT45_012468 [Circinella minor]|uniref:Uncharacterized protein n=1 Tax=Circinella minor TaxID=1195481 RepID=A0A8H7RZK4_9FUNG|nr:hypothetical protein INT45_012468 [Circinella minor]